MWKGRYLFVGDQGMDGDGDVLVLDINTANVQELPPTTFNETEKEQVLMMLVDPIPVFGTPSDDTHNIGQIGEEPIMVPHSELEWRDLDFTEETVRILKGAI